MKARLQRLVTALVASGEATAAAAVLGDADRLTVSARAGWRDAARSRRLRRWDRFDLASLTKPWVATLAVRLHRLGVVPLDLTVGQVWEEAAGDLAAASFERLLRHRAGLIAWRPLYREARDPRRVVDRILHASSTGAPLPTYSDLGYILWGRCVERLTGSPLELLLRRHVLRPLGVSTVGVSVPTGQSVACSLGNRREVELARQLGVRIAPRPGVAAGTPQDGNARHLGGLPGHAGLFAPAEALWRLGREWLRPGALLTGDEVEASLRGRGRYRLGWWTRECERRAAGPLGPRSFGHHGFTGGSVWIDPDRDLVAVLLAHRADVSTGLEGWRREFHALAVSR